MSLIAARTEEWSTVLSTNGCTPPKKVAKLARFIVDRHWPMTRGFGTDSTGKPYLAASKILDGGTDRASGLDWFAFSTPYGKAFAAWNDHTVTIGSDKAAVLHKAGIDRAFYCSGCRSEVHVGEIGEYSFILHDAIWTQATGGCRRDGKMQCVECIERGLGRKLNQNDFNWSVPLNVMTVRRSDRLLLRMASKP